MSNGTNRVAFWDFDGTLAFREGLLSSTLQNALHSIVPEVGLTAADFRAELSVGFPWHAPDVVRVTQSATEWWAAQQSLFIRAYTSAGVGQDCGTRCR